MARSALNALDELGLLDADYFLYLNENANPQARGSAARAEGLEVAAESVQGQAAGLEIAENAPDGTPIPPNLPDHPDGAPGGLLSISVEIAARPALEPAFAKPEGTPGGGGNKGGNDGGNNGGYTTPTAFWSVTLGEMGAGGQDYFNIKIEFYGDAALWGAVGNEDDGFTGGFIDAFLGAADFLTTMILSGYSDADYYGPYPDLENGLDGSMRTADDLVIEAYLTNIDGVGGILGRAGPYALPDSDGDGVYEGFPTAGLMEFDVADAANLLDGAQLGGLWNDTVFHEMMHVLGFGTLWDQPTEGGVVSGWDGLVGTQLYVDDRGTKRPTDDNYLYTYQGSEANTEGSTSVDPDGDQILGAIIANQFYLAVEADGGSGTARGHWDETIYTNEIMTGYINSLNDGSNVGANYLADFTVAAFADLGYDLGASPSYDAIAAAGSQLLATGSFDDWTSAAIV